MTKIQIELNEKNNKYVSMYAQLTGMTKAEVVQKLLTDFVNESIKKKNYKKEFEEWLNE